MESKIDFVSFETYETDTVLTRYHTTRREQITINKQYRRRKPHGESGQVYQCYFILQYFDELIIIIIIIIIMNTCCAPVSIKKDAHGAVTQAVQRPEKEQWKKN